MRRLHTFPRQNKCVPRSTEFVAALLEQHAAVTFLRSAVCSFSSIPRRAARVRQQHHTVGFGKKGDRETERERERERQTEREKAKARVTPG
jgi:hypothetical protein